MSADNVGNEKPVDFGGATAQSSHDSGAFTVPAAATSNADPVRVASPNSASPPQTNDGEQLVIGRAPDAAAATLRAPFEPTPDPLGQPVAPPHQPPDPATASRRPSLLDSTAPQNHDLTTASDDTLRVGGGASSSVAPPKVAPPFVAPPVFDRSAGKAPSDIGASHAESPLRRFLFTYSNWRRSIAVSARKLELPGMCACCAGKADSTFEARYVRTSGVRVVRSTGYVWAFPYCAACLRHVRRAELSRTISLSAGGSAFALVALAAFAQGWVVGGLIAAAIAGAAAWFAARKWQHARLSRMMWSDCACFGPAVRYDEFKGTLHRFSFANPRYAAAFERANEKKIVGPGSS